MENILSLQSIVQTEVTVQQLIDLIQQQIHKNLVIPFGLDGNDLSVSSVYVNQDGLFRFENRPPAIYTDCFGDATATNQYFEIRPFDWGNPFGFMRNAALSPGGGASEMLDFEFILRTHFYHNATFYFSNPNATSFVGIGSGSLGPPPWAATTLDTIAQLRLNITSSSSKQWQLVYGSGGSTPYTVLNLGAAESGNFGHLLELDIDYPDREVRAYIDHALRGTLPMTNWNGSRLPKSDAAGRRPLMNIFINAGASPTVSSQLGTNQFSNIELEIPLKAV